MTTSHQRRRAIFGTRRNWAMWGNQADENYRPTWKTYANHSRAMIAAE